MDLVSKHVRDKGFGAYLLNCYQLCERYQWPRASREMARLSGKEMNMDQIIKSREWIETTFCKMK